MFAPFYRWLRRAMRQKRNLAALASVLIILAMVILPLMLTASSLLQEASSLYDTIKSGELNFGGNFQRILNVLPNWATELLLALRNDVGLLAEEYDPRNRRQLGNFPQAFSHVALINTAHNLTTHLGPAIVARNAAKRPRR